MEPDAVVPSAGGDVSLKMATNQTTSSTAGNTNTLPPISSSTGTLGAEAVPKKDNDEFLQEKEDIPASTAHTTENKLIMRVFSTFPQDWDKKAPRYCILRIAQVQINRVALLRPMNPAYHHFHFAVGIQGSRRTVLKSDQIPLPKSGPKLMDSEVDLLLSMYYLHNLKSSDNVLKLALRKRRRGRNKLIGLAYLSLDELLQVNYEGSLDFVDPDRAEEIVARINLSASTLPAGTEYIETVELRDEELEDHDELDVLEVARDTGVPVSGFNIESDTDASSSEPDLFSDDVVEQTDMDMLPVPGKEPQHDSAYDDEEGIVEEDREEEDRELRLEKRFKPQRAMRQIIKRRIRPGAAKMKEKVAKLRLFRSTPKQDGEDSDKPKVSKEPENDTVIAIVPKKTDIQSKSTTIAETVSSVDKPNDSETAVDNLLTPGKGNLEEREEDVNATIMSNRSVTPEFRGLKADSSPRLSPKSHDEGSEPERKSPISMGTTNTVANIGRRNILSNGVLFRPADDDQDQTEHSPPLKASNATHSDTSLDHSVCLVESNKLAGKVLMEWAASPPVMGGRLSWDLRGRCIAVASIVDVQNALASAWAEYASKMGGGSDIPSLPVTIAYVSDTFLHTVLRGLTERGGHRRIKLPPIENSFVFYLMPLKGDNSVLAQIIGSKDERFRSLFFASAWKKIFEQGQKLNDQEGKEVETRARVLMSSAQRVHQLGLGEVLITYQQEEIDELAQLTLPFMGSIEIGTNLSRRDDLGTSHQHLKANADQKPANPQDSPNSEFITVNDSAEPTRDPIEPRTDGADAEKEDEKEDKDKEKEHKITLDYWEVETGRDKPKKTTVKAVFHLISLSLTKGPESAFSGGEVQGEKEKDDHDKEKEKEAKDKKEKERKTEREMKDLYSETMEFQALFSDRTLGVKSLGRRLGLKGGDRVGSESIKTYITKLVCSMPGDKRAGFSVTIDGTEFKSVHLVSVSRTWHGSVKSFPVAVFASCDGEK